MTLKDIPRVKAGKFVSTSLVEAKEETKSLAQRAADLLGYSAMADQVQGRSTRSERSGPLTDSLRELEIDVLDTDCVLQYQMDEVSRRTLEVIRTRLADWCSGWLSAATWNKTVLSDYTQPIPEYVINKAIQIKEVQPEVRFYIQHLSDPKADPFLIAILNKEIYYVEAWDEPRFDSI